MKAALFDVDGTVINGNCTRILLQYLFENNMINKDDYVLFEKKHDLYSKPGNDYSLLIKEALTLLSELPLGDLRKSWSVCFERNVKNKFNPFILQTIHDYQDRGVTIFLASGSHFELVSMIGSELNIRKENIIATETKDSFNHLSPDPLLPICFKEGKKDKVIRILRSQEIDLKEACFYSDNLTDLELLVLVGKGYWIGSDAMYEKYEMREKGIGKVPAMLGRIKKLPASEFQMEETLFRYYLFNKSIIEDSINELLPAKCTPDSMNSLVGPIDLTWDHETLQKYFFNPVHEYVNKRGIKVFCLGSLLFIEAAGLQAERFKALIGIGELLDICHEMFCDIKNWTSSPNYWEIGKSHLDISIIGNVAVALITMASHILISNKVGLSESQQYRLVENFVTIGFESLFGNGMELYWEEYGTVQSGSEKYDQVIYMKNKRKLQMPCVLWRILNPSEPSPSSIIALNSFVENMMMGVQYHQTSLSTDHPQEDNNMIMNALECEQRSNECRDRAFKALEKLPVSQEFLDLIRSYCLYLMNQ